jgi:tetratricopeptide (TPR) repeat protein
VNELFDLHEQVANELRIEFGGETEEPFGARSRPASSAAYLRYLLGQSFLARRDIESLQRAIDIFLESIEIDPGFGPAYLALANTYVLLADYEPQNAMFELAVATVEEGIARDPSILEAAQTYVGYVHTKRGEWMAATAAFDTAINSAVEYPPAQHYYSRLMAATGRIDDSLNAARAAWEIDQDEQVLNSRLAIAYMWNNDMQEAGQFYEIANALNEGAPIHLLSYALFLIRNDGIDEAREVARRAMELLQQDSSWVDPVFDALARSPTSDSTVAVLEEYSARDVIPPTGLVTFWVLAAQADQAMDITWQLVDDPSFFEIELIYLDEFKIMRQHKDFERFLGEMGLIEYWDSVDCRWSNDEVVCGSN